MKNSLCDLNDHLFVMLEDIMNTSNNECGTEEFENICKKASAVTGLAKVIINNASVELDALKFMNDTMAKKENIPDMLLPKNTGKGTSVKLLGDEVKNG